MMPLRRGTRPWAICGRAENRVIVARSASGGSGPSDFATSPSSLSEVWADRTRARPPGLTGGGAHLFAASVRTNRDAGPV